MFSEKNPLLVNYNENPIEMSPAIKEAIVSSIGRSMRYPDAERAALIDAIAKQFDVTTDMISLGNGSSENIQGVVYTVAQLAKENNQPMQLVVPDPTFDYAESYARAMGIEVVKVPLTEDFLFDINRLRQIGNDFDGYSLFYLSNPNSPTATLTPSQLITDWITQTASDKQYFMIDEAYAEFVTDKDFHTSVPLVKKGLKNVVVTRTFSKFYGLAGLRMGYSIAVSELTAKIESFMEIDNTNLPAAVAARLALEDKDFAQRSLDSMQKAHKIVTDALDELNIRYAPSAANFIFHELSTDCEIYQQRMQAQHILVGRKFPAMANWNRLTLGTVEEMQGFVSVLKAFREKGWV